jgi:hypothetical protein
MIVISNTPRSKTTSVRIKTTKPKNQYAFAKTMDVYRSSIHAYVVLSFHGLRNPWWKLGRWSFAQWTQ